MGHLHGVLLQFSLTLFGMHFGFDARSNPWPSIAAEEEAEGNAQEDRMTSWCAGRCIC